MLPGILQLWPVAKWILQALGFMGPEDKEKEREYQLKLMTAMAEDRRALTEAFADFQKLWRPSAERVYVWANTAIALLQPTLLVLVYYDVIWGTRRSVSAAVDLQAAGIPGLLIMAIMLFPFYGPALVQGVGQAFGAAVGIATKKRGGTVPPTAGGRPVPEPEPEPELDETETERLERLNEERNRRIIEERRRDEVVHRDEGVRPDDPDAGGLDR